MITIPLCIILIVGYVIHNKTDDIAESMIEKYCIDHSSIGASDFFVTDIGGYKFAVSTADTDSSRSVELLIFKADKENNCWTYYDGVPGGTESNFNIYNTYLEMSFNVKYQFYILYSDNVDGIATIVIHPANSRYGSYTYQVEPDSPFVIVDTYRSEKGLSYDLYDINGAEIEK